MKISNVLLITLLTIFISSCNNNELTIKGKIKGANNKTLYLQKYSINGIKTIDSVLINSKNAFQFNIPKDTIPEFYLLKFSENKLITLLIDSCNLITVNGNYKNFSNNYEITNSLGSRYIKKLNHKLHYTQLLLDSLSLAYNNINKNDLEQKKKIINEINTVVNNQKEYITEFILNNTRSFASYYAVFQRYKDGSLIMNPFVKKDLNMYGAVATGLNVAYPNAPRTKQIRNFVLSIKKQQKQEALTRKIMKEVKGFPDIAEPNINGDTIKLSSFKGKTVLLSFWASWDKNSINENKSLLKTYKKYKSKDFTVYQVSLDKSKILWEQAIEQYKLPWTNVSDLKYINSYPAKIYNVKQLPANYLISSKGKIIGKNLFGRVLDDKLSDILK